MRIYGSSPGNNVWVRHGHLRTRLPGNCAPTDVPVAGQRCDLENRGLLDQTLVAGGKEFGRTSTAEGPNGRQPHPFGFTVRRTGEGVNDVQVRGEVV